jgi:hypothetical protein
MVNEANLVPLFSRSLSHHASKHGLQGIMTLNSEETSLAALAQPIAPIFSLFC